MIKISSEHLIYALSIIVAISVAVLAYWSQEKVENVTLQIPEENIFDPLCFGNQSLPFSYDGLCDLQTNEQIIHLGSSINIHDSSGNVENNHQKILFLKMNLPEIHTFNPLIKVTISKADLILKASYQNDLNQSSVHNQFIIMNSFCKYYSWNNTTHSYDLPCIDNWKRQNGELGTFSDSFDTKPIFNVALDLRSHIEHALNTNSRSFTEMVEFVPIQFLKNSFDYQTSKCVDTSPDQNKAIQCINSDQVIVYGSSYSSSGVRPVLILSYSVAPTILSQSIITATIAGLPVVMSVFQYSHNQRESYRVKMQQVLQTLEQEVYDIIRGLTADQFYHLKDIEISYQKFSIPLHVKLDEEVSFVFLSTDAYTGIINSGSFEYFKSQDQTIISTFYHHVKVYNEKIDDIKKFETQIKNELRGTNNLPLGEKAALEKILWNHYLYLSDVRQIIMASIDEVIQIIYKEQKSVEK